MIDRSGPVDSTLQSFLWQTVRARSDRKDFSSEPTRECTLRVRVDPVDFFPFRRLQAERRG